ncbi:MFS transporter [Streptomyces sp. NPDC102467]|uniref:MFS transporter n=1 Tax=Streptomyces sp. NPDC102467 TaxID=3366179 RepID=UPI003827965E
MPELIEGSAGTTKGPRTAPAPGRRGQMSLLGGTLLVDSTESSLVAGLFPLIRDSLGVSLGALGTLTAASKIVGVVTGPLWVMAAQRFSRTSVLVVATGLWGVWGIAAGFAQTFGQLLVLYTILAAGYAAAHPLINEIIGDLFGGASRGRAVGAVYGAVALAAAVLAPLTGQLARVDDGWRWGLWGIGAFNVLLGLALWRRLRDPGHGAAERQLADLDPAARERAPLTWARAVALLRIRSLALLLVSRLLSGHLLISTFGIVYLVDVYGFRTETASVVLLPQGLGYFAGTVVGGWAADRAVRRSPRHGLVALLQGAQFAFAVVAFLGTQIGYGSIVPFAVFFGLMGLAQGANPPVNRPMVMAVVPPELRAAAFAIYLNIFEAIAWAVFGLGAGLLGDRIGLRPVFLWVLVILMIVNGLFLTTLHHTFGADVARVQRELDLRREGAARG